MRKHWLNVCFWGLILGVALLVAYVFYPKPHVGCDFSLRMYEVKCLLEHVDPFDVWCGTIHHPPYCSLGAEPNVESGEVHAVNAYPPWAYTFALPLAVLPVAVSGWLYFGFMLLSLALLFALGHKYGFTLMGTRSGAFGVATLPLCLLLPSIASNFQSFNYPFVVLMATLMMIWCLEKNRDILAGFCWAIAMLKPQLALIYAIPLLLGKRFLTCFIAGTVCAVASVLPTILVGKSPLVLSIEGIKGSSSLFLGCGTLPYVLSRHVSTGCGAACGVLIGAGVCVWLLVRYTQNAGWFQKMAIAAAISTLWSYSQLYNTLLMWPIFVLMTGAFLRASSSWKVRFLALLVALFMTRIYTFVHGFTMLFPQTLGYSYGWHGHWDSLNSLLSLVLIIVITAILSRAKNCSATSTR